MALNLLPDDHPERHLARQLVDSLQSIVECINVTPVAVLTNTNLVNSIVDNSVTSSSKKCSH